MEEDRDIMEEAKDLPDVSVFREKMLKGLLNGPLRYKQVLAILGLADNDTGKILLRGVLYDIVEEKLTSPSGSYMMLAPAGLQWLINHGHYPVKETEEKI